MKNCLTINLKNSIIILKPVTLSLVGKNFKTSKKKSNSLNKNMKNLRNKIYN